MPMALTSLVNSSVSVRFQKNTMARTPTAALITSAESKLFRS